MSTEFDPYVEWLDVASPERPPDHYAILGLNPENSTHEQIQAAFARAVERVRVYQVGARGAEAQRVLDQLSTAFRVLSAPRERRDYDAQRFETDPWQRVVALLAQHASGDAHALQDAEQIALETSPEEGPLHLARCALEQGIVEPQFLDTLDAYALRRNSSACHACYSFFTRPANPAPAAVELTRAKLVSPVLSVSLRTHLFLREVHVARGELSWNAPQPAPILDRPGTQLLAVLGSILFALPVLLAASENTTAFLIVLALACAFTVSVSGVAQLLYRPRFVSAHDVTWLDIVPALLREPPSPLISAFLGGLAKASAKTGDHRMRQASLAAAIDTLTEWSSSGLVTREPIYPLHRLALLDCLKAGTADSMQLAPFQALLDRCFGDYPLDAIDRVTSHGRLWHLLSRASLASARLRFLQTCRAHRMSLSDVLALRDQSPALRVLFGREPELDEDTIAKLLTVSNFRQWREPQVSATSAYELLEQNALGIFESWPDLILDANHRDIVLCSRGVHFEGLFLTERPLIHRASGTDGSVIVINGRFRRPNITAETIAKLNAFCEFCFGTLAGKTVRNRSQPASSGLQERVLAERIQCPRCGEKTVV